MPADLSHTGEGRWKVVGIDACIADLVEAFVKAGIWTRTSCCGHGGYPGLILLDDGRFVLITDKEYNRHAVRWAVRHLWRVIKSVVWMKYWKHVYTPIYNRICEMRMRG